MKPVGFSIARVLLTVFVIVLTCFFILLIVRSRIPSGIDARQAKQMAQLKSINIVLELFKYEFDDYPPSDALDENDTPYCGAMKLFEAAIGRDLKGVHPNSRFRQDGTNESGNPLYDSNSLEFRKGPYLPVDNANPYRLKDLYEDVGPFDGNDYVICDTWKVVKHRSTGKKVGMPVLYYKANTSKTAHDIEDPNNPQNIYNYKDNHALLALGVPGKPGLKHPLYEDPKILYEIACDHRANAPSRPKRADTFILLSAGRDGLYGTRDDIANFDFRWKRK